MKKALFIPTINEFCKIFPEIQISKFKYDIYKSKYKDYSIYVTGVGKANTAFSTGIILENNKFDEIIMLGIAGAYKNSNLIPGDLVSVKSDYFVDEGFLIENDLTLISEINFPVCDNNRVDFEVFPDIKVINSNTVSFLSSEDELSRIYSEKTKASIETMEGAASDLLQKKSMLKLFKFVQFQTIVVTGINKIGTLMPLLIH